MDFKQRFKYLKNEKINLIKVIQECLVYQNIHILLNLFIYSKSHFDSIQNKSKKCISRKKNLPNGISF